MASEASLKWVWRGSALGVLLIGWLFILIQNKLHLTPSVIYVMLAYLAGVGAVYALFRMGASAVGPNVDDDPDSWVLPQSARDELEREKRTLLKAIKEAEFDAQMGKLSKRDLDEMVRNYRLRAIDVIKLLEERGNNSTRDQILREVRARAEVDAMHAKVERAHAALTKRKNPNRAAAAAQAAARAAAAAGASPDAAREAAKQAAVATDLEAEDIEGEHPVKTADAAKSEAQADDKDAAKGSVEESSEPKAEDVKRNGKAKGDEAKSESRADDVKTDDDAAASANAGDAKPADTKEATP